MDGRIESGHDEAWRSPGHKEGASPPGTYLDEDGLDHRPTVAAIGTLLGRSDLLAFAGEGWLDAALVHALARGRTMSAPLRPPLVQFGRRRSEAGRAPARMIEIILSGESLLAGLTLAGFPEFGLWVFRSRRLFLAIRCGSLGWEGRGAHDHNDQLGIELAIDGEDWITDPGSYVYTASPTLRNAWRSVAAHFAPRWDAREPGRLDLGLFWLGDARARCLAFDTGGFVGEHSGYGRTVRREIALGEDRVTIRDTGLPGPDETVICRSREELAARFPASVPFSPGYGKRRHGPIPAPW